jgi:hypothetical protein
MFVIPAAYLLMRRPRRAGKAAGPVKIVQP